MEQDLKQYLAENQPRGFRPVPHYFATGDYVTYYVKDDRCCAERVDDLLTVFLSNTTGEMVGCKIKGVRRWLEAMGGYKVVALEDNLSLIMFLVNARFAAKDQPQRQRYDEAILLVNDASISRGDILAAVP